MTIIELQPDEATAALERYYAAPAHISPDEIARLRQEFLDAVRRNVQAAEPPTFFRWVVDELGISHIAFWRKQPRQDTS